MANTMRARRGRGLSWGLLAALLAGLLLGLAPARGA